MWEVDGYPGGDACRRGAENQIRNNFAFVPLPASARHNNLDFGHGLAILKSAMPDRSKNTRRDPRPRDPNQLAYQIMLESTGQAPKPKNPAAVALGRLGGLKGGAARAAKLGPRKRSQIATKAAQARWGKKS
jgi:hypothetical protein